MTLTLQKTESCLGHRDWRLPENRIEAFSRVAHVRMVVGDCDHHHVARVISDLMCLDNEQKALYCLFFGQSYRNHHAMIALQLGLYDMSYEQLQEWTNQNWQRFKYSNDTKWGVRRFPHFVKSLQDIVGSGSVYQHFYDAAHVGNTRENYYSLSKALHEIWGMGRMTSWLAQQTFYELFDWDIDHWDQQLYAEGTWSQYNSLCYIFDRMEISRKRKLPDGKIVKYEPTKADIAEMEDKTLVLMTELNKRIPFHVDIYNIESVECEFRKTSVGPKVKEFTFWTANELVEQFSGLKAAWEDYKGPGRVEWSPYVAGFMTKGSALVDNYGYDTSYFRVFIDHGINLNTHYIYRDEPDAHVLLNLPKKVPTGLGQMQQIWEGSFTEQEREALRQKHNPVRYLKFKPKDHPAWSDPNADLSYAVDAACWL